MKGKWMDRHTCRMGQMNFVFVKVSEAVDALIDNRDRFGYRSARTRKNVLGNDIKNSCLRRLWMTSNKTRFKSLNDDM